MPEIRQPPESGKEIQVKQVTVKSVNGQTEVRLNNAIDSDALTAKMAKAAQEIAFGVGANVTVYDRRTTFRVTKSGARKQDSRQ